MSITSMNNCYAVMWSYGKICVHCNCCGRFDSDEINILKARLEYHETLLKESLNFDNFVKGKEFRKMRHIQGVNNIKSINYQRKKVNKINSLLLKKVILK